VQLDANDWAQANVDGDPLLFPSQQVLVLEPARLALLDGEPFGVQDTERIL